MSAAGGSSALVTGSSAAEAEGHGRSRWNSQIEFTITCIGYAVGLGNFWRFPYLCYMYGGGAFLVPYTLTLLIIGIPIFLMELAMGQKMQLGSAQLWKQVHPALGGLGVAGVVATFIVGLYYNVIVAWALWYLFNSFSSPLPWSDEHGGAQHFWEVSTLHCRPEAALGLPLQLASLLPDGSPPPNASLDHPLGGPADANGTCSWADVDFPQHPGLADTGGLVPPLVGCLLLAWFLIWICVCKGIESIGRIAWFTSLFPYVVLFILLVRGVTLP